MNSKLTLDYGMRVRAHDAAVRRQRLCRAVPDDGVRRRPTRPCSTGPSARRAPCRRAPGNNQRALNPVTGQVLGTGQQHAVGSLVPNVGDRENGSSRPARASTRRRTTAGRRCVFAPRFGGGVRPQRQPAADPARRRRHLLRPHGRQPDLRPVGEPALGADDHGHQQHVQRPRQQPAAPRVAVGLDGLPVQVEDSDVDRSGTSACRWRCRGRRRSTSSTSATTTTTSC